MGSPRATTWRSGSSRRNGPSPSAMPSPRRGHRTPWLASASALRWRAVVASGCTACCPERPRARTRRCASSVGTPRASLWSRKWRLWTSSSARPWSRAWTSSRTRRPSRRAPPALYGGSVGSSRPSRIGSLSAKVTPRGGRRRTARASSGCRRCARSASPRRCTSSGCRTASSVSASVARRAWACASACAPGSRSVSLTSRTPRASRRRSC
mmetsp:Transcript_34579/g.98366  ORF Transcript_34579/g.98366 Transcript_34579/m.98366 type:complete len:211 (+) Transcript_34579:755-1387(+)